MHAYFLVFVIMREFVFDHVRACAGAGAGEYVGVYVFGRFLQPLVTALRTPAC
jgi:hypothetical protein